ncbi:hypothetical protein Tcan_12565 [Toxocara canis]|uniref:Uncharacterized protein n=1 Tax=Toxocara canis TaxID=6265 RepID=A0A0B2UUH3_TOXCA|nr:hypothetical protein Tcan_12565 [Toxocara canis]
MIHRGQSEGGEELSDVQSESDVEEPLLSAGVHEYFVHNQERPADRAQKLSPIYGKSKARRKARCSGRPRKKGDQCWCFA